METILAVLLTPMYIATCIVTLYTYAIMSACPHVWMSS